MEEKKKEDFVISLYFANTKRVFVPKTHCQPLIYPLCGLFWGKSQIFRGVEVTCLWFQSSVNIAVGTETNF